MNISIFGLGYVGCIVSGCLANHGHNIIGVDINEEKVNKINCGQCPTEEDGLPSKIADAAKSVSLRATTNGSQAVLESEVSFISVGTPLDGDTRISMSNLYSVMDSISNGMEEKDEHTIVIRSTVLPGTTRNIRNYLYENIDGDSEVDFVVNPEFLREGSAIDDFYHPPYIILGSHTTAASERIKSIYREVGIKADVYEVDVREAEMLKIVNNSFHALKISFANEIGSIASQYDIDGKVLMDLVCEDGKLNISDAYLEPGMAFGGSCLPKDTQSLDGLAEKKNIDSPIINNILESNTNHLDRIAEEVKTTGGESVGIVGLSFKSGTNDMRNSPSLRLIERLSDYQVNIYAKNADIKQTVGANREYIDHVLNEYEPKIFDNPDEFLAESHTILFTNGDDYSELRENIKSHTVVDPVGFLSADTISGEYRTVSW